MITKELKLREYAGQGCDAYLYRRSDGTKYVRFEWSPHFGHPSMEIERLKDLLRMLEEL